MSASHHHDGAAPSRETPSVCSRACAVTFTQARTAQGVGQVLSQLVERLAADARDRGLYVGHVKLFAQGPHGQSWWVSTTGRGTSLRAAAGASGESPAVLALTLSLTVIVFGTTNDALRDAVDAALNGLPDARVTAVQPASPPARGE